MADEVEEADKLEIPPQPVAGAARDAWQKLALILLIAAAMTWLVLIHFDGVNGSLYHAWPWRRIAWWRIYPAMFVAGLPFWVAQFLWSRRTPVWIAIGMLMLSMFSLQVVGAAIQVDPFDIARLGEVVEHPTASSYFTVAQYLATQRPFGDFLVEFPSLMQSFALHARQKPPGMILYYYALIKLWPWPQQASVVGGLLLGVLASIGVPATYLFARRAVGTSAAAAFGAASYFSLCPGLVLFFPMFDVVYPVLTCAILGFWVTAMRSGRIRWAVATGAAMTVAVFLTYNILVVGAFMALVPVVLMRTRQEDGLLTPQFSLARFVVMSAMAAGVLVAAYAGFYLTTGFNAITTFRQALVNQRWMEENFFNLPRPWPNTIPGDVYDFFLGSGWVSLPLLGFWLIRAARKQSAESNPTPLVMLGLIQILIVAVSGLLRVETARVWALLQPLAMLPIGIELSRWPAAPRAVVYFCLWFFVVMIDQNMKFLLW